MPNISEELRKSIEASGVIPEELSHGSLHFCGDWDGLLIDNTDHEYTCCVCRGMP